MTSTLQLKKHGACGTIILNRPECRNALSRASIHDLLQALSDFQQERSVRAVVLTGAGEAFCSGLDLAEMRETMQQEEQQHQQWYQDAIRYREVLEGILRFPKPVIAAVNGAALGAGAAIVLACDIAIGSNKAAFGFPEPRRGIVSGVATPLLHFRIGASRAAYLLLNGNPITAEQALAWGVYQEVVDESVLWARGNELTSQIALSAHEAIQLTKKTLNETVGEAMMSQLAAGAAASATSRTTEAAEEGVAAFNQKREPNWP